MECMSLMGFSACAPNAVFRGRFPFDVQDIDRESMPPLLRRRSSLATQMAFSAAAAVCVQTRRLPAALPSIFASVAGEIMTTDQLCSELAKPEGVVSPNAFHNSVQNTAAGYWSIAQHCTHAATSLAGGIDTFAMAMLEAWCQLSCHGGELLLVCYDECWPSYLDPIRGESAVAVGWVLAAGVVDGAVLQMTKPQLGGTAFPAEYADLAAKLPILAALPLLALAVAGGETQTLALSTTVPGWQANVQPLRTSRGAS